MNDIIWCEKENAEKCESNSLEVADYGRRFPRSYWSFLGLASEKKWYGTHSDKPDGVWDKTTADMMLELAEAVHPVFRSSSALKRRELRSKGGGKKTIHFNGSEQNVELILRTIISANPLSTHGAVADMCTEVSKDTMASEKPESYDLMESMEMLTLVPMNGNGETCCKNTSNNLNNYLTTRSYPNYVLTLV